MKSKNALIYAILILFLAAAANRLPLYAQLKIGLINTETVMQNFVEMTDVQKSVNELTQLHRKKIEDLNNEFVTKSKAFESQSLLLSEERKKQMKVDLEELYRKGIQYQQEKFGTGGEIEQKYKELTAPIVKKINETIAKISEDEKFDLVFDVVNMGILYANPDKTIDITEKVLAELNKGAKPAAGSKKP